MEDNEQLHIDDFDESADLLAIIEEMESSLKYEMYELVEEMPYGGFLLSACNERGKIIFFLVTNDRVYSMCFSASQEEYKKMTPRELGKWINTNIYYSDEMPLDDSEE